MTLKLNFFAKSDRGLIRDNNEDSGYAGPHPVSYTHLTLPTILRV